MKTNLLPEQYLQRAIGRTRDVLSDESTQETLHHLETRDRPTWLLSLAGQPIDTLPQPVQRYLAQGEELGLPRRPLISTRKPWYKMEKRPPPPFLFAYLGRRHARFFLNSAGVVPLSCFLCVYPHRRDECFIEQFWRVLQHPATVANLALVGKSYGAGAIKVEPRALEQLPIPQAVLEAAGMSPRQRYAQPNLFSARV